MSLAVAVAELGYHVVSVVGRRPQKQVPMVEAWGIVATMADIGPIRDRAVRKLPRDNVRIGHTF